MSDIYFISNEELEERIQIVSRQTDYAMDEIREKLLKHNYDTVKCIKEYLGSGSTANNAKTTNTNTKKKNEKSVNQQIYTELRKKLEITKEIKPQIFKEASN